MEKVKCQLGGDQEESIISYNKGATYGTVAMAQDASITEEGEVNESVDERKLPE